MKPGKRSFGAKAKDFSRGMVLGAAIGLFGMARGHVPPKEPLLLRAKPPVVQKVNPKKPLGARLVTTKPRQRLPKPVFPRVSERMSVRLPPGAKCISPKQIDTELRARNSPAAGFGEVFVKWGRYYKIRPVVALAFFRMESNLGTRGLARKTKAIGNIRYTKRNGSGVAYTNHKGFRRYASWEHGIRDFYWLLSSKRYAGGKRRTLKEIIPVYAPASENDIKRYKKVVVSYIDEFFKKSRGP